MLDEKEKQGKDVMKRIVNEEALWILESIVEARKCRPYAMFHEDTSNHCSEGLRISDSHVPDVRQNFGSVPGTPRFEDALVSSGLPYGDDVDA